MKFLKIYSINLSYTIKIDVDALSDIQNTFEWYELQVKGLGLRYKNQAKKQINFLKKNPCLFSIKYNVVHCYKMEKFPFLIHNKVDELEKIVSVFALFHTSRNPEIWKHRNK